MKKRYLLSLLLLSPFLAHADALKALGEAQAFFALLILGIIILVIIGFLIVIYSIYSWPHWAGVPYVVGLPLALIAYVRLAVDSPGVGINMLLLLALLLNGLVWVRRFRPMPVRIAGVLAIAIATSVAMVAVVLHS